MPTLPVTVLSGFLGSGKTTLVNQILRQAGERRFAVIVNDMAELNLDQQLIRGGTTTVVEDGADLGALVEIHGGCVCCSMREDLIAQVSRLARSEAFDALVIEATGVAEPLPLAMAFDHGDPEGDMLGNLAQIDTMITVVDARNFLADWERAEDLQELNIAVDRLDNRAVADLLAEQVEFANQIIVNKADLVSEGELRRLTRILECLNPEAEIITTMYAMVEADRVLDTGLFAKSQLEPPPDIDEDPRGELNISSFVYRSRRPFHPGRLWKLLHENWPGVLRSKGLFWLATRMNDSGLWSQAGQSCSHQGAGRWWSSVPQDLWPDEDSIRENIDAEFDGPFGDRRQEIVLIGQEMDREELTARLDECLLDDLEMQIGPMGWTQLPDPFPAWVPDVVDETDISIPSLRRETPLA